MAPRDAIYRTEAAVIAAGGTFRADGADKWRSIGLCHDASRASDALIIFYHADKGDIGLHCHAGCDFETIKAKTGLTDDDLHDEPLNRPGRDPWTPKQRTARRPVPKPKPKLAIFNPVERDWHPDPISTVRCKVKGADGTATYETHRLVDEYLYLDEHWRLVFGVCRCEFKHFSQWRPDPTWRGGRHWGVREYDKKTGDVLAKVKPVPYRCPQLLDGIRDERTVWIPEGERDVLSLVNEGMVATCCVGGSGMGWDSGVNSYFANADVRVVADRDEAGRRLAEAILRNLMPVARSVDVVQARHGKDATNHLEGGGHVGDFVFVAEPKPLLLEAL